MLRASHSRLAERFVPSLSWRMFPPDLLYGGNPASDTPQHIGNQDLIYCCQRETERRSQRLRHNGLCRGFTTSLSCELRRLGFSLPLHCSALFNHGQVTPFIVDRAAFGRFMRRSRIPKHSRRHIYSRCEVRSCGAVAGARTLGVNFKGRMGAGNPLSPRHADSIRAACKLRSL